MAGDENPYGSPTAPAAGPSDADRLTRRLRWCLIAALLLTAAQAIFDFLVIGLPNLSWLTWIAVIGVFVLYLMWLMTDARLRDFRLGPFMKAGLFFISAAFLPVYFYRSRGLWRGSVSLALALLYFVAMLLTYGLAYAAIEYLVTGEIRLD